MESLLLILCCKCLAVQLVTYSLQTSLLSCWPEIFFFYLFPNTSALVFWPFFCTTSFRLKSFFISCRGARQRAETAWGRSSIRLSHGSIGGRGAPGFTPRWCRHWGNEKKTMSITFLCRQTLVNLNTPLYTPVVVQPKGLLAQGYDGWQKPFQVIQVIFKRTSVHQNVHCKR